MPKKFLKEPEPLSSTDANPWDALPGEVQVDIRRWDKKVGETTERPVDGQEQPKIYEIRDHMLEVFFASIRARIACCESPPYTTWR